MRHLLLTILLSVTTLTSYGPLHQDTVLYCDAPTISTSSVCWEETEVYYA
jgi:hypothetical protein